MYSSKPSVVYGFHGMDKAAAIPILNYQDNFRHSNNIYDWLGDGVYFWENNHERAKQYAIEDMKRPKTKIKIKIKEPFVLGAVIELGNCLDLLDQKHIDFVKFAHSEMVKSLDANSKSTPINSGFGTGDFDFKRRELDCAVIRHAHAIALKEGIKFDSVRAAFMEGNAIYSGAKFFDKNHIQISILNPNCIKGIFLPRQPICLS